MSKTFSSSGACCPPRAEGVVYLPVGADKVMIGMLGLERIFQQLQALDRRLDEATDTELVNMARKFNYIPDNATVEADYAAALRAAYARFCAHEAKDERQME